ncbi:Hypothetical predicted protein [Podarcis lilfordi]|uniref:Uncharacterized protein n=1 Tax=Podarcis lilfordi TaxID=74358 RepID=A0AA35KRV7_9SAUR|nr:Hypothetical predicted protein [Podarcis lilfordi]
MDEAANSKAGFAPIEQFHGRTQPLDPWMPSEQNPRQASLTERFCLPFWVIDCSDVPIPDRIRLFV